MAWQDFVRDSIPVNGERRCFQRIRCSFDARIRCISRDGSRYETDAVIDSLSAGGLTLRSRRRLGNGDKLFIVFRITYSRNPAAEAPRIAAHGTVLRSARLENDVYMAAVYFNRHRFL